MQQEIAAKSRHMAALIKQIRAVCHMTGERRSEKRRSATIGKVKALVDEFNALAMPRAWVGIDHEGRLHLTRLARTDRFPAFTSTQVSHMVDFMWDLHGDGSYVNVKDRTGEFRKENAGPEPLSEVLKRFAL